MSKRVNVGGQAVIEGVMMRGQAATATAVRKPDGEIIVKKDEIIPLGKRYKILALPLIRGFVNLIESLVIGIKALNYSSTFFEDDEDAKESKIDQWMTRVFKDKTGDVLIGISLVLSLIFSMLLFFILPTTAANIFKKIGIENVLLLNILEGVIRVGIFLAYIYLIGKMGDIKRVFQYHGAEHKTIFCYENGVELTPENAQRFGRLHPRCGTNFMFLVMIVSIVLFTFTGWGNYLERIFFRLLLLPVVSGVTYEIIRWMGKSEGKLSKIMSYPGLMLQKLTTKEPDLEQLEVAIASLKAAEGIEE
ncbi:Uncharacterized conserved protein YqhQ [Clostridium collagenovorans DSM 3089]|uniref:Uncharacterized conserved protein YqhQ n=1 Tax=Clostridium collagenovorans DSM 3089 TaxID=1121306 RepID=A0A1M5W425_9CLOT|nr:DUF1385 domain-containing protein [Clostridium collagenovorans]SHH81944.1 Uncharacterized conserved protein YqhQ [Clostridium collagenovorans DSM 3089]